MFLCFDDHPELIRSHLARRENILNDDYVTVMLDPFQDRQRGVEFQVNPSGVQADAAWTETSGADYSYDQVWDSDGRITQQGMDGADCDSVSQPAVSSARKRRGAWCSGATFRATVRTTSGRGCRRT